MSTTFWYHPESDSFYTMGDDRTQDVEFDVLSVELDELEWNKKYIEQCLRDKKLPEGINAILLKPQMHPVGTIHKVPGGSWILSGSCHLYPSFRDGFEVHTTLVNEWLPGGIVKTASKCYLIELKTLQGEYPRPIPSALVETEGEKV